MNKLKLQLAAFAVTALGIVTMPSHVQAQFSPAIIDTGSIVPDFVLNDVNGGKNSLYSYLDQGYTVAIELSKTTCNICWAFHEEGLFEMIYEQYGPKGTVMPKKILPVMIECDPSSTDEDLRGKGTKTYGDWVSGVSHPIVDLKKDFQDVMYKLLKPGIGSFATPTFLVICPDRKVVYTNEGSTAMWEEKLIDLMEGRCTAAGTGTEITALTSDFPIDIFPNPGQQQLNIQLDMPYKADARIIISNTLGQNLITKQILMEAGMQTTSVDISRLAPGMYILNIKTNSGAIQKKFTVKN